MVISAWDLVEIRIISAWDLVFSFWDKDLFLHGIFFRYWDKELFLSGFLCLGTEIKRYFCLGSCT
jgi:hypothetical protein